jgi:hypothetical protein
MAPFPHSPQERCIHSSKLLCITYVELCVTQSACFPEINHVFLLNLKRYKAGFISKLVFLSLSFHHQFGDLDEATWGSWGGRRLGAGKGGETAGAKRTAINVRISQNQLCLIFNFANGYSSFEMSSWNNSFNKGEWMHSFFPFLPLHQQGLGAMMYVTLLF